MLKKANLLRLPVDVELEGIDKHEFAPLAAPSMVVVAPEGAEAAKKGIVSVSSTASETPADAVVSVDPMDVGFGNGV